MAGLLVVVSVEPERQALVEDAALGEYPGFDVVVGGVGPAVAAAATAMHLVRAQERGSPYGMVICAGIAGGFAGRAEPGATVLASRVIAADLGADSADGFLPLDQLGFGHSTLDVDAVLLAALRKRRPDAVVGAVLTVATVTGTAERAAQLLARHPDAAAEGMEGYGVASAAALAGVAFAELRTVSNRIGPRDRSTWRIPDALAALSASAPALVSLTQ